MPQKLPDSVSTKTGMGIVLVATVLAVSLGATATHAATKKTTAKKATTTTKPAARRTCTAGTRNFGLTGAGGYTSADGVERGAMLAAVNVRAVTTCTASGAIVQGVTGDGGLYFDGAFTDDECNIEYDFFQKAVPTLGFVVPTDAGGVARLPTVVVGGRTAPGSASQPGTIGLAVLNTDPPDEVTRTCGDPPMTLTWTSATALEALRLAIQGDKPLVFPLAGGIETRTGAANGFTWDMRFELRPGTAPQLAARPTTTTIATPRSGP